MKTIIVNFNFHSFFVFLFTVVLYVFSVTSVSAQEISRQNQLLTKQTKIESARNRRDDLIAARKEIVKTIINLTGKIDELPYAADNLKNVINGLNTQLAAINKEIAQFPLDDSTSSIAPESNTQSPKRDIVVSVDTKFGHDKQVFIGATINNPQVPVKAEIERSVSSVTITAQYPITSTANLILTLPYIQQLGRISAGGQEFTARGRGIGDVTLSLEKRFPEIAKGTSISLSTGMQFPTGTSPYGLTDQELPTGTGLYQPQFQISLQKRVVPMQFYITGNYGISLSRRINGQDMKLPDSYGGEVGFLYSISSELATQTGVSFNKTTSPFQFEAGTTEGYLTQSITYNNGGHNSLRASIDVGLTPDSMDYLLGLGYRRSF